MKEEEEEQRDTITRAATAINKPVLSKEVMCSFSLEPACKAWCINYTRKDTWTFAQMCTPPERLFTKGTPKWFPYAVPSIVILILLPLLYTSEISVSELKHGRKTVTNKSNYVSWLIGENKQEPFPLIQMIPGMAWQEKKQTPSIFWAWALGLVLFSLSQCYWLIWYGNIMQTSTTLDVYHFLSSDIWNGI